MTLGSRSDKTDMRKAAFIRSANTNNGLCQLGFDGQAGRRSSWLNSRSVCAVGFGCHRGTDGLAREGLQETGVLAVESRAEGKQSKASSAKVIIHLCVERRVEVECKPWQSEYHRNVKVLWIFPLFVSLQPLTLTA